MKIKAAMVNHPGNSLEIKKLKLDQPQKMRFLSKLMPVEFVELTIPAGMVAPLQPLWYSAMKDQVSWLKPVLTSLPLTLVTTLSFPSVTVANVIIVKMDIRECVKSSMNLILPGLTLPVATTFILLMAKMLTPSLTNHHLQLTTLLTKTVW